MCSKGVKGKLTHTFENSEVSNLFFKGADWCKNIVTETLHFLIGSSFNHAAIFAITSLLFNLYLNFEGPVSAMFCDDRNMQSRALFIFP